MCIPVRFVLECFAEVVLLLLVGGGRQGRVKDSITVHHQTTKAIVLISNAQLQSALTEGTLAQRRATKLKKPRQSTTTKLYKDQHH